MKKDSGTAKMIGGGLALITALTLLNLYLAAGGISAHKDQGRQAQVEIVTVEGCQYFGHKNGGITIYAHKGNCTNSIHVYNGSPVVSTNSVSTNSVATP